MGPTKYDLGLAMVRILYTLHWKASPPLIAYTTTLILIPAPPSSHGSPGVHNGVLRVSLRDAISQLA
jgi:hypothetical protein